MNRRHLLRAAPLGLLALGLGACTRPIYNAPGTSFAGPGSLTQRSEQIRRAGAGLGWAMQEVRPGLIRGTLSLRTHQAVVDIPYDTSGFAIRYVDSTNLSYDGSSIHRNYNSWVQNLERAIVAQSSV